MSESLLNCAVLGLGRLGMRHAESLAKGIPGARLAAVSDPVPERLEEFTEQYEVKGYSDYREILSDSSIDAVLVVTPTTTHVNVCTDAARAGKHIFCEKPVAMTLSECDALAAVLDETKVYFQVGFMRRFDAGYAAAKRQIEEGLIGDVIAFNGITRDNGAPAPEFIRDSGGMYLDVLIHEFDIASFLVGSEITRVYARGKDLMYGVFKQFNDSDHAYVIMDFASGALGNLEGSRCGVYGHDIRAEIIGTKGTIQVGYLRRTPAVLMTKNGITHDALQGFVERFGDAYVEQIKEFVRRVRTGAPSPVTVSDGRQALLVSLAATISHRSDAPVQVVDVDEGSTAASKRHTG